MTGLPCVSEALHGVVGELSIEERAKAIMRHGMVKKLEDRSAALFRAELPDGAVYTVVVPLACFALWRGAALYEADAEAPARQFVLERLVEQLDAEGIR